MTNETFNPVPVTHDAPISDGAANVPNGETSKPSNGNGKPRVLPNKSAKPAGPKLLTPGEFVKLDSKAQVEAIKAFRDVQRAKAEEERKNKPRRGNGGGTSKLLALVLKDAKLNGPALYAAIKKAGIVRRDSKALASTTIDTTRYDMAHRVRAILASGMTMQQLKAWLADFDATPRSK